MGAYIQHTATSSGRAVKQVQCQWCACTFTYIQSAEATGTSSTGWWNFWRDHGALAAAKANASLDQQLAQDAPSRCPSCGRFQASMFGAVRQHWAARHTWKPIALALLMIPLIGLFGPRKARVGGFFESFLDRIFEFDLGWVAVIGATLAAIAVIRVISSRIDPNLRPESWNFSAGTPAPTR